MKKTKEKKKIKLPRAVRRLFPQVTNAIDASEPVEVSVQARDCKDGKKSNPMDCALARAAKRELHVDGVIIGISSSYLIKDDTAVRFNTPESVRREIVSFDRNGDFATGDYYLTPKCESLKLGSPSWRKFYKTGKTKTVKRKVHISARVRILPKGSN